MKERILTIGEEKGLVGILTEPEGEAAISNPPCILFLNAGRLHRVGPNRLHVKIARHLAKLGFRTCRFDFSGVGDSPSQNHDSAVREYAPGETIQLLDHLEEHVGARRFILFGICLGADVAFQTATRDPRVVGAMLVNGSFLATHHLSKIRPLAEKKARARYYRKRFFSAAHWRRILSGKSKIWKRMITRKGDIHAKDRTDAKSATSPQIHPPISFDPWHDIAKRRIPLYLLYAEGSSYLDIYRMTIEKDIQKLNTHKTIEVEILPDIDHVFTLLWSQELLLEKIQDWIARNSKEGETRA